MSEIGHSSSTPPTVPPAQPALPVKLVALLCYLLALAGQAALTGLVLLLGFGLWSGPFLGPLPWETNLVWLLLFALQHSGMARHGFKRRWTRRVPAYLERSLYAGLSGLVALGLAVAWQPVPGPPLWELPAAFGVVGLVGAASAAVLVLAFDQAKFLGLWQGWHGRLPAPPEPLRVVGPYRFVRHPLMTGTLLFLWGQPLMTPTLALLSGGLTAYVLLALPLEERELLRRFGDGYRSYRRRVPALLPWRAPAAAATYPAREDA